MRAARVLLLLLLCACGASAATPRKLLSIFDIGDFEVDLSKDGSVKLMDMSGGDLKVRHVQLVSGFNKVEDSILDVPGAAAYDKVDAVNLQVVVGALNTANLLTKMNIPSANSINVENRQIVSGFRNKADSQNQVQLGAAKAMQENLKAKYKDAAGKYTSGKSR